MEAELSRQLGKSISEGDIDQAMKIIQKLTLMDVDIKFNVVPKYEKQVIAPIKAPQPVHIRPKAQEPVYQVREFEQVDERVQDYDDARIDDYPDGIRQEYVDERVQVPIDERVQFIVNQLREFGYDDERIAWALQRCSSLEAAIGLLS